MIPNVNLEWAKYYTNIGLSIFPVREKIPLVPWKTYQNIPATIAQLEEWWSAKYPNADIGCVTGQITGRLVLDVDGPTGAESVKELDLPVTQSVRTRRGVQYHYLLPMNVGKTTLAGILPGVDVRGDGGYVKMPPSSCSDGTRYAWMVGRAPHEVPLAAAPTWLVEKLTLKPVEQNIAPASNSDNWIEELFGGVGMGNRHQAFIKLAGYYFNCMHPDVAAHHLRDWNAKCTPPMEDIEDKIADFTRRFQRGEYESKYSQKQQLEARDLEWLTAEEVVAKYNSRIEFLVDNFIPAASNVIFGGWQGLGKTFVATDLILEVSRKIGIGYWLGRFNVQRGPVLYVDNEIGGNRTSYRLSQLLPPKGLTVKDLNLHYLIRNRFKLANEKHYQQLRAKIEAVRPKLVVVDSFASCCAPLDENTAKDMRHFFDDLVAPLCDEFKTTILFIDHEGKGVPGVSLTGSKRLRGSGAKGDAVDMVFSVQTKDGVVLFEHSKVRDTKRIEPFAIEIADVPNGVIVRELQKAEV